MGIRKVNKMEDLEPEAVKELRALMHFGTVHSSKDLNAKKNQWIQSLSPKEALDAGKVRLAAVKEYFAYTRAKKKAVDPDSDLDGLQELIDSASEEELREAAKKIENA